MKKYFLHLLLCALFALASTASLLLAMPENETQKDRRMTLIDKATKGDINAMFDLAVFYELRQSPKDAKPWLEKAAEQNHIPSLRKLAFLAERGSFDGGVDYELARKSYHTLTEQGVADAYVYLGLLYRNANASFADPAQAEIIFLDGVQAGSAAAAHQLGLLYFEGFDKRGPQYENAYIHFLKAAQDNIPEAMRYTGLCYLKGYGTPVQIDKAWYWYSKASQRGDTESDYILAEALYTGTDMTRDLTRSLQYYRKAAAKGHDGAMNMIRRIERSR